MKSISLNYSGQQTRIFIQTATTSTYTVGDKASMEVLIEDSMVRQYANSYGDRNPIHLDEAAGRNSIFGARVAHGMLAFGFFSTLLGAGFPGPGSIFVSVSDWSFAAPVFIGDKVHLEVTVESVRQKKNGSYALIFGAVATGPSRNILMSGRLSVIAPAPASD